VDIRMVQEAWMDLNCLTFCLLCCKFMKAMEFAKGM